MNQETIMNSLFFSEWCENYRETLSPLSSNSNDGKEIFWEAAVFISIPAPAADDNSDNPITPIHCGAGGDGDTLAP